MTSRFSARPPLLNLVVRQQENMDHGTRQLLLQNDSETDIEYPPGFDWRASMASVRALKTDAERILGQPMKLDDQVQDASFFAELFVFEDGAVGPNGATVMVFKIVIRFSTFGKMATIHTNSPMSDLHNYPVDELATLLEQYDFQVIAAEALGELYDGKLKALHQCVGGQATWWYRYFDYM